MPVLTTFEYSTLKLGEKVNEGQLKALQAFHGNGTEAFSLVHHGIRTGSYVGVIQLGQFTLEILPKADKADSEEVWRGRLVSMLRGVTKLPLQAPTESSLALKPGAVLHLYFELLVKEVEVLVRRGLVRQYQRKRRNATALKGRLVMSDHLRRNLIHKERFAVEHDVYDRDHIVHQVLAKALKRIGQLDHNNLLASRLAALRLDFPEQSKISVSPALFERLAPKLKTRKFSPYARAIHIARLLLLNQHPDVQRGRSEVLALLFDMNSLWEGFVASALRRYLGADYRVQTQTYSKFWLSDSGTTVGQRPDIIVTHKNIRLALDTKWKMLTHNHRPSEHDLRQLYAYSHYYNADAAALLYPGDFGLKKGTFVQTELDATPRAGHLLAIPVGTSSTQEWMQSIAGQVRALMSEAQTSSRVN